MRLEALNAALTRFWAKVRPCPITGCWQWWGAISRGGQKTSRQLPYGSFWAAKGMVLRAHVFVAWAFGIIKEPRLPPGYQLDHTCENSLCVNPWHLELVTKEVNQARRHKQERRPRPTWAELYTFRGVRPQAGEAVEPRHIGELL